MTINRGDLFVRRDAGLIEVTDTAENDDVVVEVSSGDGADTIDRFFFDQEYVKLTAGLAASLRAAGLVVPVDGGE